MISRYEKKDVSYIWSEEYKFKTFLEVELDLLLALEEEKKIPEGISKKIHDAVKIIPERINEIELTTRHDVIAFCTSITEQVPVEIGKYFHFGVTSSDIIDSGLTLQIKASLELVFSYYDQLLKSIENRAVETKNVMTLGRSHGIFAEPMSFGQKLLGHYSEFKRRYDDLKAFYNDELTIQLSGAVGNYTILNPQIEEKVAKKLGLKVEPVSTQIIPRDRIAKLISITSLVANAMERLAVELRHLHHSDVKEVSEGFQKGQKGSSTMPHKKNPISAENITGLSRLLRSHLNLALENSILWHERDISHSSNERMYLPDHFGILCYCLERLGQTINNLEIDTKFIEEKVMSHAHYLSSYYLHSLIEKVENITREELYALVQKVSFDEVAKKSPDQFRLKIQEELKQKNIIVELPYLDALGIKDIYLKHVDHIFNRILK
jgi:adenylosuccinate lyase